jgi:hypothetical protein
MTFLNMVYLSMASAQGEAAVAPGEMIGEFHDQGDNVEK